MMTKQIAETGYSVREDGIIVSPEGKELKGYFVKGFLRVQINGKRLKIHRLVAQAFIPNPMDLPYVLHKDGDKTNNKYTNLEWSATQSNHGRLS